MTEAPDPGLKIAIMSRYNLAEQYDLAAEFEGMVHQLCGRHQVLHLSLSGPNPPVRVPDGMTLDYLPAGVDRSKPRDILLKTALMYLFLPIVIYKLRRFRPGVVFFSEIIPLYAWLVRLGTGAAAATAYGDWHVHNIFGGKWWSKPILKIAEFLERWEMTHLDGAFCRAGAAGDRLQEWGMRADQIRVVHDAPDPEAFSPRDESELRASLGHSKTDVVLLYHGVMHQGKGLDLLTTWTAELMEEDPRYKLVLVGGGPEGDSLRALTKQLGISDRVHFTGWLPTIREVGDYCNAADLCIAMRTRDEANDKIIPGALLHSMACGKVVIGPGLRGIAEIIDDGHNGYTFEPDNGESFKQLIRRLADSRSGWESVANAARDDIVRNFSVPAAARKYAEAIEHYSTQRT